ncbi:MAG: hypothetical protein Q9225_001465 [Loekoesia sp. 1 TL-2023]
MANVPITISPSEAWDGNDGPRSTFALGFGTPPQFVRVLVSTTCPQPWAVDPLGCTATDAPNCVSNRGGLFNKNSSSTWEDQGFYELDQELNLGLTGNGDFGLDSITLGYPGSDAITVEHQLLATIAAKDFYVATWGIAPRPTNLTKLDANETTFSPEDSHQSLLSTLKERHEIPSLSYGYTAGAKYRLKQVTASLTFGGYDASRFEPSNLTFDLAVDNSRDLVVGIQSISVLGSSHQLLPTPVLAFVDATIPHIWLPLEACQVFETIFGINWDPTSDLYLVNETIHQALLAQNATLVITIGTDTTTHNTISLTLPYASFDLQALDTYPNVKDSTRHGADGLSAGTIAAIVVAPTIFLAILVTILTITWRRKQNNKAPGAGQLDQGPDVPSMIHWESEQELHAEELSPPELHGKSTGPPEMEDGIAAAELSATQGERCELQG